MSESFTPLERNILLAKGITAAQMDTLANAGVSAKADFATIGDAATLAQLLPGLGADVAGAVMEWAIGPAGRGSGEGPAGQTRVVVDTADVVSCVHCGAKQPKDYRSGDLCPSCGKPSRIGHRRSDADDNGKTHSVRICKRCNGDI